MKLRFIDPSMRDKFANLVRQHGYEPSVYFDTGWYVVETAIDGKRKRALMQDWAEISLDDQTKPNNQQKELKL